jgi:hypothetical protein
VGGSRTVRGVANAPGVRLTRPRNGSVRCICGRAPSLPPAYFDAFREVAADPPPPFPD